MAKLFNNAGDKPILPSTLKPPIAMPSRRTLAGSSGPTSRFDERLRPLVARRGARGRQHGAVDSDGQTRRACQLSGRTCATSIAEPLSFSNEISSLTFAEINMIRCGLSKPRRTPTNCRDAIKSA